MPFGPTWFLDMLMDVKQVLAWITLSNARAVLSVSWLSDKSSEWMTVFVSSARSSG
jgi:hypothetical protein